MNNTHGKGDIVVPDGISTPAQTLEEFDLQLRNGVAWLTGVTGSYLFHLSGEDGGTFHLIVRDGVGSAGPGSIEDPDVTFTMADQTFMDMKGGTIDDGAIAFLNGEVIMEGDQALALALAPLWFDGVDVTSYVEN
jgi:hypothetical protein